jgi:signal transduction histidine kinase
MGDQYPSLSAAPEPGSHCELVPARIVYADDSATQRALVRSLLGDAYDVTTVPDGLAALASVRQSRPDVVLSDLRMPGLDGLGLLRAIRSDEALCRMRFILITGEEDAALQTMDAGADDYLAKPYRPEVLRSRVASAVRSLRMFQEVERQHAELSRVHEASRRLELELQSAQKLEAVGRLASGIAHEINTPVQFITDNTRFLGDAFQGLVRALEAHQAALASAALPADVSDKLAALGEELDLPYLVEQVPGTLSETLEGLRRVTAIVRAMREFAHPDQKDMVATDLNRAMQATLEVARNEYKYVADVETDLGAVPLVTCHAGDVNQVFLALIVNAAQAIAEAMATSSRRGVIRIQTAQEDAWVRVSVRDDGGGIPEEIRRRVFEPFFTTRAVGRGKGLGLAMAHAIAERHGGTIRFESVTGQGTTFHLRLPVAQDPVCRGEA